MSVANHLMATLHDNGIDRVLQAYLADAIIVVLLDGVRHAHVADAAAPIGSASDVCLGEASAAHVRVRNEQLEGEVVDDVARASHGRGEAQLLAKALEARAVGGVA